MEGFFLRQDLINIKSLHYTALVLDISWIAVHHIKARFRRWEHFQRTSLYTFRKFIDIYVYCIVATEHPLHPISFLIPSHMPTTPYP